MANITLKDVNGNNIYPEVDVSTLSGTIEYGETGFTKGGDVYDALESKANLNDIPYLNVKIYDDIDYTDTHLPYNNNMHNITSEDLSAKEFYIKLPLNTNSSSNSTRLMGDIYGARIIKKVGSNYSGISLTNSYVTDIELQLGDSDGNPITDEPIIRKIDSNEFATSDRHYNDSSKTGQCIFHFSHFGACSTNMQLINTVARYLLIKVNLPSSTPMDLTEAKYIFEIFVGLVEF